VAALASELSTTADAKLTSRRFLRVCNTNAPPATSSSPLLIGFFDEEVTKPGEVFYHW